MGSGKSHKPDHINVDINPKFAVDILSDMRYIEFQPESFQEILAKDVIDHVTYAEAKKVLAKIYRWLKPNGVLTIHTPNLRFLASKLVLEDEIEHEALRWLYATDGEDDTHYSSNVIRWCYSKSSLRNILEKIGFHIIECWDDCAGFAFVIVALKR